MLSGAFRHELSCRWAKAGPPPGLGGGSTGLEKPPNVVVVPGVAPGSVRPLRRRIGTRFSLLDTVKTLRSRSSREVSDPGRSAPADPTRGLAALTPYDPQLARGLDSQGQEIAVELEPADRVD